jgi:O-methyltransferase domain
VTNQHVELNRARLRDMITAFRVSDLVATAAQFRLADYLADGPRSSAELAQLCGADPAMLHRVMRALARIELVYMEDDGRFALAPLGELLRSDIPDSMYKMARLWATDLFKLTWMRLPHSVRTGQSAQEFLFGLRQFDYLSTEPEVAAIFNEGMFAGTLAVAAAALDAYDFSRFETIVDVGGGSGAFATTLVRANPNLRGIVLDLPYCEQGALEHFASAGVGDRCEFVAGDFFKAIPPGADAYVLKFILHDWEDEKCAQILKSCRAAATRDTRLLLVEAVLPEDGGPLTDAVFGDITMIVHTGGRERTEAEYAALLEAAGFRLTRVVPTRVAQSVIEATIA